MEEVDSNVQRVIRRLHPADLELMQLIQSRGRVARYFLDKPGNERFMEALVRCKSRSLVTPIRKGTNYVYDLTDFGIEVLATVNRSRAEPT